MIFRTKMTFGPVACAIALALCTATYAHNDDDTIAEKPQPSQAAATVKLIEPGIEPRRELRIKPALGPAGKAEMLTHVTMKQRMDDMDLPPTILPVVSVVLSTVIENIADNGDITYASTFADTSVRDEQDVVPMMRQQMEAMLRSMRGTVVRGVVSNRGITREASLTLPDEADPRMLQQMEGLSSSLDQFSAPVPDEPVGIGAVWTYQTTVLSQGMSIQQTATYTLTEMTDDEMKLDVTLTQRAEPQQVENPNLPPGATMELLSFASEGSGTVNWNLSRILPVTAQVSISNEADLTVSMQGQTQRMHQQLQMDMRMADRPDRNEPQDR